MPLSGVDEIADRKGCVSLQVSFVLREDDGAPGKVEVTRSHDRRDVAVAKKRFLVMR
jgi:hypothetical protein